jgi:hypothetical protein
MGFSAPKPDPAIAAQQAAQAAEAKRNKISSITDQLANEDQIRTRLYGARGNPLFGAKVQSQGAAPLAANIFGSPGMF